MHLSSGARLGPYETVALVGSGGMGEVYRAQDTRLDRAVAIKVLPAHLAENRELRQRLEREAKTVSSLNHPHICILHDIGHQDGIDYLVMEYLEGDTLAARLAKGPLPPEQALPLGIQIADALEAAHRIGVVHRDLKPANIMLTRSGAKPPALRSNAVLVTWARSRHFGQAAHVAAEKKGFQQVRISRERLRRG
jgi:eukaryotic-like serine/threonine-protein kinase